MMTAMSAVATVGDVTAETGTLTRAVTAPVVAPPRTAPTRTAETQSSWSGLG